MLIGDNVDNINEQIELLKKDYKLIKIYESAFSQKKFVYKDNNRYKEINMTKIIDNVNQILRNLDMEPIHSIDELDDILLSLQIRFMTVNYFIETNDENNFNNINRLESDIEKLTGISYKIKYYSGIVNCKNLLMSAIDRTNNNGYIVLNYNTGLIKDLIEFKAKLSFELDPDVYKNVAQGLDRIISDKRSKYSAQEEENIIYDLKRAVRKISNHNKQTRFAIEILALENRHRNNIIGLKKVNPDIGIDLMNRPVDIKALINEIPDINDKNALENLSIKYKWFSRDNLTLNEIIDSIDKECNGKDEYIGSTLLNRIQMQIDMKKEQLSILKSQNTEEKLRDLSEQQQKLFESLDIIYKYVSLKNQNIDILRSAKLESNRIIFNLYKYNAFLIENIKDEVDTKLEELDSYLFDFEQIKKVILSGKVSEDKYDELSEEERFKIFSKYYLERSNSIYIDAIKSYCLMPTKINYIIEHYNYKEKPLDDNKNIIQFMNDLQDFFDKIGMKANKKAREILSSKSLSKRVINQESTEKKLINISRFNPKFNLQRSSNNLKLYRQYLSKKILNMVTNVTIGINDLGEYNRYPEQLIDDSEYLANFINSQDGIPDILGQGQVKK